MRYRKHFSFKDAKQNQRLPGKEQIKNSDNCYVFEADDWKRLDRFLILGSEGGSYYASEKALTIENAEATVRCINENGVKAVERIVEISDSGRAAKNDQAIFALAIAAKLGDEITRKEAYQALPKVCRIPTHLFSFVDYCEGFGGWGRGMRRAVSRWYTQRPKGDEQLAYHLVKYQQRNGWSNRDLLRLCHARPNNEVQDTLFHWVTKGKLPQKVIPNSDLNSVVAFELAKGAQSTREIVDLIERYNLTREMIPTNFLKDTRVWEALLQKMPLGALVRNLGNLTKCDLVKPFSQATKDVVEKLTNKEAISKSRIHPMQLLVALNTYKSGGGARGSGSWKPVAKVCDAIEVAFYKSFENIEPTGKNHLLCIDTSGSMTWSHGQGMAGLPGITPRVASAVMAMVTAKTEEENLFISYSDKASEMNITSKWTLHQVIDRLGKYPAFGTNCSAPIEHAIKRDYDVDAIVLYTDSETNNRNARQPVVALEELRQKLGHDVKFIVVGMVANNFSVADPNDSSMLDVVGFDTAAPKIIGEFVRGKI